MPSSLSILSPARRQLKSSGNKSGVLLRASFCIPCFFLTCVMINSVLVWTFLSGNHHEPLPTTKSAPQYPIIEQETMKQQQQIPKTVKMNNATTTVVVVAHVVSLIKCGKVGKVTGFLDAAAVLRHSIHHQSVHASRSRYSYKMYAIVHEECASHTPTLDRLGYHTMVRPTPIVLDEIRGEWYRNHVENENCCGSKEFIKLYAYKLTEHPIVVHWDMDVAILQPMDDLFDAMLYPHDSPEGRAARANMEVQHPDRPLPPVIDAYFTRDITSARPWEKVQGVQGGFLVARPSEQVFETYLSFIREGNYTKGRGDGTGWAGLGYGGFQGAMAYQGVVAYYYDHFHSKVSSNGGGVVELNVCRWNQVVADVIWRGPQQMNYHMQCREYSANDNNNTDCEDCRVTPIEMTKTAHYTACKKPWECTIPHPRIATNDPAQQYRLNHLTNITTCGKLFSKWFAYRKDLEDLLQKKSNVEPSKRDGAFYPDYFLGYCQSPGRYIAMNPPPPDLDMKQIYGM